MDDQQALAVGGGVFRFHLQLHAGHLEVERHVFAHHLVVVAGHVNDLGAGARHPQDQPQHFVVMAVPEPGAAQAPAVDDVADQEEVFAGYGFQKVGQEVGAAATGAEVGV